MTQVQVNRFLADLRDALGKLESLPMPTIAAIDGPALGGGLEMSLACDLRVAGKCIGNMCLSLISRLFPAFCAHDTDAFPSRT